jgi:hypothetical protein
LRIATREKFWNLGVMVRMKRVRTFWLFVLRFLPIFMSIKKMVFENGPQWAKLKIFYGDIYKAVKFNGRRLLLHGSELIPFRAQKDISI